MPTINYNMVIFTTKLTCMSISRWGATSTTSSTTFNLSSTTTARGVVTHTNCLMIFIRYICWDMWHGQFLTKLIKLSLLNIKDGFHIIQRLRLSSTIHLHNKRIIFLKKIIKNNVNLILFIKNVSNYKSRVCDSFNTQNIFSNCAITFLDGFQFNTKLTNLSFHVRIEIFVVFIPNFKCMITRENTR